MVSQRRHLFLRATMLPHKTRRESMSGRVAEHEGSNLLCLTLQVSRLAADDGYIIRLQ